MDVNHNYNKLVRDKIPNIIEHSGKKCIVESLDNDSYFDGLNAKLVEELEEYLQDFNIEELADLLEVVYAILDYKNVSRDEFKKIRQTKLAERGGFATPHSAIEVITGIKLLPKCLLYMISRQQAKISD